MNDILRSEWRGRLNHWKRVLNDDFYEPLGEISWEYFETMDHLTPEAAQNSTEYRAFEQGTTWGHTWEYGWFRGCVTLPAEAQGRRVVLNLQPGWESTLFVDGKAFGTYRAKWVAVPHQYYEDNVLSVCGEAGRTYEILMETYCGHFVPETTFGPVRDEEAYRRVMEADHTVTPGVSTYGIFDEDAYQLWIDVDTLDRQMNAIDPNSLRASRVADALEQFTMTVDFEQPREKRDEDYRKARKELRSVLDLKNSASMPTFYGFGHAHLDLAWLWPMAETHRKTARTFAAQLRLMEQYPDYRFVQSQPAAYEMCREHYPELFERIREAVKRGQWIADGGMWVEPDTNMASGEALIRQFMYGKKYYREVMGTESEVVFLPDSFGYSAALPQIMKGCGMKYLVTSKIYWNYNQGEEFPYHYFYWKGADGSVVTAFLPTEYGYQTYPDRIQQVWNERRQRRGLEGFLIPFGYGDGGGGPTRDHIEYIRREDDLEGTPHVKMTSPREFFRIMEESGGPKATYDGELYFAAHRGTYTSQGKVKYNNRRCEEALREMEFWGAAALLSGVPYDNASGERLWKRLLLHQFHDILPGSSIARVYAEAEPAVEAVIREASERAAGSAAALTGKTADNGAVSIFNSLSFDRTELVVLPDSFAQGAVLKDGTPVPVQQTAEGVKALVKLPAAGAVSLRPGVPADHADCGAHITRNAGGFVMENEKLTVRVNGRGEIESCVMKESGRELAAGTMNVFHMYRDVPRWNDAWDIDSMYAEDEVPGAFDISVTEAGQGMEAVLRVEGKIGNSSYTQNIRLVSGSSRLDFETEVDWKELHRLLKTAFTVDVQTENGFNEMQFCYVERPTHRSRQYEKDRFEVAQHRYTALCDNSHGVSLLNNCKYGISMNGNSLELTLLKAAGSPDYRADNRVHRFTYSLYGFETGFAQSGTVQQGLALNIKPVVINGEADVSSLVKTDRENIILDTMKPAEDGSGDLILRFYESARYDCNAVISGAALKGEARLCSMLEECKEGEENLIREDGTMHLHFKPFEVVTVRIS